MTIYAEDIDPFLLAGMREADRLTPGTPPITPPPRPRPPSPEDIAVLVELRAREERIAAAQRIIKNRPSNIHVWLDETVMEYVTNAGLRGAEMRLPVDRVYVLGWIGAIEEVRERVQSSHATQGS